MTLRATRCPRQRRSGPFPPPLIVERVQPVVVVEDEPKSVGLEPRQFRHHSDEHVLGSLFVESADKMVVIDHVVSVLRSQDHWDHVPTEKLGALIALLGAPRLAFGLNLSHAYGDLRGPQRIDRNR